MLMEKPKLAETKGCHLAPAAKLGIPKSINRLSKFAKGLSSLDLVHRKGHRVKPTKG